MCLMEVQLHVLPVVLTRVVRWNMLAVYSLESYLYDHFRTHLHGDLNSHTLLPSHPQLVKLRTHKASFIRYMSRS